MPDDDQLWPITRQRRDSDPAERADVHAAIEDGTPHEWEAPDRTAATLLIKRLSRHARTAGYRLRVRTRTEPDGSVKIQYTALKREDNAK